MLSSYEFGRIRSRPIYIGLDRILFDIWDIYSSVLTAEAGTAEGDGKVAVSLYVACTLAIPVAILHSVA
jgi:hypothetical protein